MTTKLKRVSGVTSNPAALLSHSLSPSPEIIISCLLPPTLKLLLLHLFSHSVVSDSATPWTAACQASPSFTISQSFLKFMSTELVMPYTISSSVTLLFLPSISQASGSFTMSQLFPSGDQSIRASASVLVLPVNVQGKFSLELDG